MSDHWSQVPEHLLDLITNRLDLDDLIRFSFVCRTWRSFSSSLLPPKLNPWLIVPYQGYTSQKGTICNQTLGFFNLYNHKTYKLQLPHITDRRICGSCKGGWLITVHENGEIKLLHPFSKSVIDLPPITTLPGVGESFVDNDNDLVYDIPTGIGTETYRDNIVSSCIREFYIFKAVTSSANPSTGMVMAIQGLCRYLSFCRPGQDREWFPLRGDDKGRFSDVTFFRGKFYAVQNSGLVFVVDGIDDVGDPYIKLVISPPPVYSPLLDRFYLVESSGELFSIRRTRYDSGGGVMDLMDLILENPPTYKTINFFVTKLDVDEGKWVDVDDIGNDRALFVGYNDSFSLTTLDFTGCKGNCIYFTDDCLEEYMDLPFGGHDIGLFHLRYGYIEKCYPSESLLIKPPPVWFAMNL